MRFKVVPPVPESLDRVEAVWRGVPIVPDAEESCCRRLMRDADVPAQDTAKEWLTFSRALGLAEEGPRGYARVRDGYDPDAFPARFREGVYAADETLAVLADADEPLSPDEVFDRLRDRVPAWERAQHRLAGHVARARRPHPRLGRPARPRRGARRRLRPSVDPTDRPRAGLKGAAGAFEVSSPRAGPWRE
ncbi:hypothetical protein [Halosegnis marinus]|uniref:hypothetical protein n=1 Tax=Halosegnis marinus TaxID=3034023 RepID=UPI0036117671